MANDFVTVNNREMIRFSRNMKIKRKSQIKAVQRQTLNNMAFETRKETQRPGGTIDKAMRKYNGFAKSSIFYEPATNQNMRSVVGSKYNWRRNPTSNGKFYGMSDKEFGGSIRNPGINTTNSRTSKSENKNVTKANRDILRKKPIDINSSEPWVITRQLMALDKKNTPYAFRIRKSNRKFKKGVYKFGTKKIKWSDGSRHSQIVMLRDDSKQSVTVSKKPWMLPAYKKAASKQKVFGYYRNNFERYTKQRVR